MPLTFQIPNPSATRFIRTYTAFTTHILLLVLGVSYFVNTAFVCINACSGFLNNMKTIMMEKIWSELPDMYIMIAFMGSCFAGARATSQDFLTFRMSVSSGVGGLCGWDLESCARWGTVVLVKSPEGVG